MLKSKNKGYITTHINTQRYRCRKSATGYPVSTVGRYESLFSFKELPPFKEMKKNGRKWRYTKNYYIVMDRIVLDVDAGNLEVAYEVTKSILKDFKDIADCINVYFSGSKGFHIEILTEEVDIVDTTAEKPMYACPQYVEFLNYYQSRFNEVDLSLKDVGTRIIRIHHTKHEKTGNYKILADMSKSLKEIEASSKKDVDMVPPAEKYLSKDEALLLLRTYSKPLENEAATTNTEVNADLESDYSIFAVVFNELTCELHRRIFVIGCGLNGYVDKAELEAIYNYLAETTNIEESENAKQSFIDAYENDEIPFNLGELRNEYKEKNLDQQNFLKLSRYLDAKHQKIGYAEFNILFEEEYGGEWFNMLEEELYDYVDNNENIFKGIINCLCALYGYGSRFLVVNGGSEVGKSEYIKAIKKLMPRFENLGSSTPASVRRSNTNRFNRKIAYLGDKGLRGKSQASQEEFEGLYEVFGGLITENEFIRDVVIGDTVMQFHLKSVGTCAIFTEPYTNLRVYGAGDQYTTRSTFITLNPVKDGLKVFLLDETQENPFYTTHKNYIKYILNNPINLVISDEVKTEIYNQSNGSLRTAKYILGLFKAYCQYIRVAEPTKSDVEPFMDVFKPYSDISNIEYQVYEKLYSNLKPIPPKELEFKIHEDGSCTVNDMLMQMNNRKDKIFFTAKQIQTYFKNDFKNNKNLKDTTDQIPQILKNLYNAGYMERLEWQYNGWNVYYFIEQNNKTEGDDN